MDKIDKLQLGVIYIGNNEKCLIDNKEDLFNTIPGRTNYITYELDEDIKKRKLEIEKATKHLNNEMDEAAEEFYKTKKDKEKDDGLSL